MWYVNWVVGFSKFSLSVWLKTEEEACQHTSISASLGESLFLFLLFEVNILCLIYIYIYIYIYVCMYVHKLNDL